MASKGMFISGKVDPKLFDELGKVNEKLMQFTMPEKLISDINEVMVGLERLSADKANMSLGETERRLQQLYGNIKKITKDPEGWGLMPKQTEAMNEILSDAMKKTEKIVSDIGKTGKTKMGQMMAGMPGAPGAGMGSMQDIAKIPGLEPLNDFATLFAGGGGVATAVKAFEMAIKMFDASVQLDYETRQLMAVPGASPAAGISYKERQFFALTIKEMIGRVLPELGGEGGYEALSRAAGGKALAESFVDVGGKTMSLADAFISLKDGGIEKTGKALANFTIRTYETARGLHIPMQTVIDQYTQQNRLMLEGSITTQQTNVLLHTLGGIAKETGTDYQDMLKWTNEYTKAMKFYGIDTIEAGLILNSFADDLEKGIVSVQGLTKSITSLLSPNITTAALEMQYLISNYENLGSEEKKMVDWMKEMRVVGSSTLHDYIMNWDKMQSALRDKGSAGEQAADLTEKQMLKYAGSIENAKKIMDSIAKRYPEMQMQALKAMGAEIGPQMLGMIEANIMEPWNLAAQETRLGTMEVFGSMEETIGKFAEGILADEKKIAQMRGEELDARTKSVVNLAKWNAGIKWFTTWLWKESMRTGPVPSMRNVGYGGIPAGIPGMAPSEKE